MERDRRVRYLRRPVKSGGCGAPRNYGIDATASPADKRAPPQELANSVLK